MREGEGTWAAAREPRECGLERRAPFCLKSPEAVVSWDRVSSPSLNVLGSHFTDSHVHRARKGAPGPGPGQLGRGGGALSSLSSSELSLSWRRRPLLLVGPLSHCISSLYSSQGSAFVTQAKVPISLAGAVL